MDILFSVVLFVFCAWCFFLAGAGLPDTMPAELGAAFWPKVILVLLMVLLAVNLAGDIRERKEKKDTGTDKKDAGSFFNGRLPAGMALAVLMAVLLGVIGFIPDCLLFMMAYGYLLGERRLLVLAARSFGLTLVFYVFFLAMPGISLAGGIGPFAEFSRFVRGLMPF